MSNPSKSKGTAAETALVRWLRANGFPGADRQPLRGGRDQGDVALCPGVVVEVKYHAGPAATGQPTAATLAAWLDEVDVEQSNAGAAVAFLVVKRKGTTDPGRWFAYVHLSTFVDLTDPEEPCILPDGLAHDPPVQLAVADLAALLRAAGYGDPIAQREGAA